MNRDFLVIYYVTIKRLHVSDTWWNFPILSSIFDYSMTWTFFITLDCSPLCESSSGFDLHPTIKQHDLEPFQPYLSYPYPHCHAQRLSVLIVWIVWILPLLVIKRTFHKIHFSTSDLGRLQNSYPWTGLLFQSHLPYYAYCSIKLN